MGQVRVIGMREPLPSDASGIVVNTTSKSDSDWQRDLSPFHLGPCELYDAKVAVRMENAWQYTKVYQEDADTNGDPTPAYWTWAEAGWANPIAVRYPKGKGARPLHCLWKGQKLGYIDSRKQIYAPLYIHAVTKTAGYKKLQDLYASGADLWLRDFDGYDHVADNHSLTDVLNYGRKKMGHAFVLAMLLTNDAALKEIIL